MLADAHPSCYVHQQMRIHESRSNSHACGEQVASKTTTGHQYQQIKLALDVHAASIVVVRMIAGAKPQMFKPADFRAWPKKQMALAQEVIRNLVSRGRIDSTLRG